MVLRGSRAVLGPDDDEPLHVGDQVLFVGHTAAHRALSETMTDRPVSEYVLYGRTVPGGWLWQRLTRREPR